MKNQTIFSKDFTLVVIGRTVSVFGSQILRYALPLYLLLETGSSALFGSIMGISFIPMIILFPIGGIIADRMNLRNIMLATDFCTAILIAVFCLLADKVDIVLLITITMVILFALDGADRPAVKASVPALVKPEQMLKANSIVDMVDSAASMAGPVTGGLLFSFFGLMPILYVSIGCFLLSSIMDLFICIPFKKRETTGNILAIGIGDLKESFHFLLKKKPILWKIALLFASTNLLLTSLILVGLPVLVTQQLDFAPDIANRLYGYAQGMTAAGAVLGGLLAGVLANRLNAQINPILLGGCAISVTIIGAALQMVSIASVIYGALLVGCGMLLILQTLFQIQMTTYLQLLTPEELIGKVISCFLCVAVCTIPLGQFIYGLAFEYVPQNSIYLLFYGAGLIMIGVALFSRRIFKALSED
jgi:Major Facilitator Superfamily.